MSAVEMTILGRTDPRLLVATRTGLDKPKKAARLLAALSNSARTGTAVLLLGVDGRDVTGLDRQPDAKWWAKVERSFPGRAPILAWTELDIGGARIVAVFPNSPAGEPIIAHHGGRVSVPWIDESGVRSARTGDFLAVEATATRPAGRIQGGWIEHARVGREEGGVDAFGGYVDVALHAAPGRIDDSHCVGALLFGTGSTPVEMTIQIHPEEPGSCVRRVGGGVEISDGVAVRLYVAGAQLCEPTTARADSGQLLMTIRTPGQTGPLVIDALLRRDNEPAWRWVVADPVSSSSPSTR
ncbi:MAG: hypothetical protein ACR2PK_20130 [Acidimicrobiales bacterium]